MIKGIDISAWQSVKPGDVDFVKAYNAGARFIFHRAAFGNAVDSTLVANWPLMRSAGITRGLYHFASYMTYASTQASFFANILGEYPPELPAVLDLEFYDAWGARPSGKNMCAWAAQYLVALDAVTKRSTILYTNLDLIKQMKAGGNASDLAILADHPLWFAYPQASAPAASLVAPWTKYTFWQDSWKGDGVAFGMKSLSVDTDYFMGTQEEFNALAGIQVIPEPPPDTSLTVKQMAVKLAKLWKSIRQK
jgi:lysozyme